MTQRRIVRLNSRAQQRGMTMLVGLILLLLLTVISTIGFRNTTLSERMTGNSVDRNVSFQSAESAGKEALTVVDAGTASALATGYYASPISQGGTTTYWTQGATATGTCPAPPTVATVPFNWTSCSALVTTKYANNANKAQYAIELLASVSSGGSTVWTYRVTSRSTGGSGSADVVLQTIYVRTTTP